MYPTIGRIVLYVLDLVDKDPIQVFPAIITRVLEQPDRHGHKHPCNEKCATVCLTVFLENGTRTERDVDFSANLKHGYWSWPPRA